MEFEEIRNWIEGNLGVGLREFREFEGSSNLD
jgi:hypothetical protein